MNESCRFKLSGLKLSSMVVFGIDCSRCLKDAIVSKPMMVDGPKPRQNQSFETCRCIEYMFRWLSAQQRQMDRLGSEMAFSAETVGDVLQFLCVIRRSTEGSNTVQSEWAMQRNGWDSYCDGG